MPDMSREHSHYECMTENFSTPSRSVQCPESKRNERTYGGDRKDLTSCAMYGQWPSRAVKGPAPFKRISVKVAEIEWQGIDGEGNPRALSASSGQTYLYLGFVDIVGLDALVRR